MAMAMTIYGYIVIMTKRTTVIGIMLYHAYRTVVLLAYIIEDDALS